MGNFREAESFVSKAIAINENNPIYHAILGDVLRDQREFARAEQAYRTAISLKPDFADIYNNLGSLLRGKGAFVEAEQSFRKAIECNPLLFIAHNNLGLLLDEQGKPLEAIKYISAALKLNPNYTEAWYSLGNIFKKLGHFDKAADALRRAIVLRPENPFPHGILGNLLLQMDKVDEAIVCYRKGIELKPDFPDFHKNLGNAFQVKGRFDESRACFETAIKLSPANGESYRLLAQTGHLTPGSPHFERLRSIAANMEALPKIDQMEVHFALGKIYGDLKEHELSFRHLLTANSLKRHFIQYDEAQSLKVFDRIRRTFTERRLADLRSDQSTELPVFIVGMPRSGTTLVEQILSSHPDVFGAGELIELPRLTYQLAEANNRIEFPEVVLDAPQGRLNELANSYLSVIRRRSPTSRRIIDKLPDNFLRLGLINMIFPHARIIHVIRDPVDTCLSCFSILFSGHVPYAYDLAELGRYYRAYEQLMEHWRRVLPDGVMLDVRYEDVVANLETEARRMLAHCGLAWDARCLSFQENQRTVQTASVIQVRQSLYGSSIGLWHKYGELLRPLLDALRT